LLGWFFKPWRWRWQFPLKLQLIFNGLYSVISQKTDLFINSLTFKLNLCTSFGLFIYLFLKTATTVSVWNTEIMIQASCPSTSLYHSLTQNSNMFALSQFCLFYNQWFFMFSCSVPATNLHHFSLEADRDLENCRNSSSIIIPKFQLHHCSQNVKTMKVQKTKFYYCQCPFYWEHRIMVLFILMCLQEFCRMPVCNYSIHDRIIK
jgi:hypothetical protein